MSETKITCPCELLFQLESFQWLFNQLINITKGLYTNGITCGWIQLDYLQLYQMGFGFELIYK